MSCNCHTEQVRLMESHSWNNQETIFTSHSAGKISSTPLDENVTVLFFLENTKFPVYFNSQNIISAQ